MSLELTLLAADRYVVAFSGGLDSTVLLHCLAQKGRPLLAVHVNHHLDINSDEWSAHCADICQSLNVPYQAIDVSLDQTSNDSLEALARHARYAALRSVMKEGDVLLTAHHEDDQAETLLLQLLRGAGVKGLAAMPSLKQFAPGVHQRPLLPFTRECLMSYAKTHDLKWVEDPSNGDTQFFRNALRRDVMPRLKQLQPQVSHLLSRSALHCAEASRLLDDLAMQDLEVVLDGRKVLIEPLLKLSEPRQKNVLRYWLHSKGWPLPSSVKLNQILNEIIPAREDANPCVAWPGAEVRRFRGALYVVPPLSEFDPSIVLPWDGISALTLPGDLGSLNVKQVQGGGVKLSVLNQGVDVRFRQGSETVYLPGRLGGHSLKKLFQEWGVPTWERGQLPLLYQGDELIAVVGYCVCRGFEALEGERGAQVICHPVSTR